LDAAVAAVSAVSELDATGPDAVGGGNAGSLGIDEGAE